MNKENLSVKSNKADSSIPITRIQKLIGNRMLESKQHIPCFYLEEKVNLSKLTSFRRKYSKSLGVKISTNDFFVRAMGLAVRKYPLMSGQYKKDKIEIPDSINVGLAVAAGQGLVVPTVKQADKKTLSEIADRASELINKARSKKLSLDELAGACITLSNLGMFDIDSFVAIVPPGQGSILAIGRMCMEPIIENSQIKTGKIMSLTLSADSRVVRPGYAAEFLEFIIYQLENPKVLTE